MTRIEHGKALDALPSLALQRRVLAEDRFFVTRPEEFGRTLEQREQEIAALGAAPNSCFLVARRPGVRVAGFLIVNGGALARTQHVARLELMVGPEHRRQGIGRALIETAIGWAERGGVVRKLGLAVLTDNAPAIALYRSCGFVEEGRRLREYQEADGRFRDDLLLAKWIGSTTSGRTTD